MIYYNYNMEKTNTPDVYTTQNMNGTAFKLKDAARVLLIAAERLEKRDGWHLEHSLTLIEQATKNTECATRQINREIERKQSYMRKGQVNV